MNFHTEIFGANYYDIPKIHKFELLKNVALYIKIKLYGNYSPLKI